MPLPPGARLGPYEISKDGKRFLVNVPDRSTPPSPITVVLNWPVVIKV
jgi:hypothetical protein